MVIRKLSLEDIDRVLFVQSSCYGQEYLESRECFTHKLTLFPGGCFGVFQDGKLAGYLFSHPWRLHCPVPLDDALYFLPETPDCIYLHDLAILPAFRKAGVARSLLRGVIRAGHGTRYALVAVQNSGPFWHRLGFRKVATLQYGTAPADYMVYEANSERI